MADEEPPFSPLLKDGQEGVLDKDQLASQVRTDRALKLALARCHSMAESRTIRLLYFPETVSVICGEVKRHELVQEVLKMAEIVFAENCVHGKAWDSPERKRLHHLFRTIRLFVVLVSFHDRPGD